MTWWLSKNFHRYRFHRKRSPRTISACPESNINSSYGNICLLLIWKSFLGYRYLFSSEIVNGKWWNDFFLFFTFWVCIHLRHRSWIVSQGIRFHTWPIYCGMRIPIKTILNLWIAEEKSTVFWFWKLYFYSENLVTKFQFVYFDTFFF